MTSKIIRDSVLNGELDEPVLFKNMHKNWIPLSWSLDEWGKILEGSSNQPLRVRCGQKQGKCEETQWESDCKNVQVNWKSLVEWDKPGSALKVGNINNSDFWMYYDYKYMVDILEPEYLEKFEWSKVGFPERNGQHSTLWIGTQGAYTPCHFDTYGCNFVTQIVGRKKWILFPPEDTKFLKPTRVPYEESSVYTQINVSAPTLADIEKNLSECRPVEVTLEAGDVLFVPPQWWHFVKSQDFAISVNTWVELGQDVNRRLEEAIIRSVVSCVVNYVSPDSVSDLLNPNEVEILDMTEADMLDLLKSSTQEVFSAGGVSSQKVGSPKEENHNFLKPNSQQSAFEKLQLFACVQRLRSFKFEVENIGDNSGTQSETFPTLPLKTVKDSKSAPHRAGHHSSSLQHLINAIGHPDILKQIATQFLQNISQDSS